jgi:OmpA-OmpF porin, OOP family
MTVKRLALVLLGLAAVPVAAHAQEINAQPGFYIGGSGGMAIPLSSTSGGGIGWAAMGTVGYDFVGPRIALDVGYGQLPLNFSLPGTALNGKAGQLSGLVNLYYDFFPTSTITPYVGAGAGIAFIDSNNALGSTQFAWDAILGAKYNMSSSLAFSLEGRYIGTTSPSVNFNGQTFSGQNQNILVMAGITYKFNQPQAAPPPPPPPPVAAPSFMVFFDWDRSNLSQQALNTIQQAANAYKTKGNARVTATGHTDTTGPEAYNMALSLRRANTVKDALVRDGVPAAAISVIGKGETQLLVQTGDQVREPQNRRVEIVIQ